MQLSQFLRVLCSAECCGVEFQLSFSVFLLMPNQKARPRPRRLQQHDPQDLHQGLQAQGRPAGALLQTPAGQYPTAEGVSQRVRVAKSAKSAKRFSHTPKLGVVRQFGIS